MQKLIINYASREKRSALISEGTVSKVIVDQPAQRSLAGNIYFGIITKVLPGMNAAFADIGEDKNAFLPLNKIASFVASKDAGKEAKGISSFIRQGEKLLLQVEKDPSESKGARVTGIIEFSGQNLVYMPEGRYVAVSKKMEDAAEREQIRSMGLNLKAESEGLIFRTSSSLLTEKEISEELNELRNQYKLLAQTAMGLKKPCLLLEKDFFFDTVLNIIGKMNTGEIIVDELAYKKKIETEIIRQGKRIEVSFYNAKENIFSAYRIEQEIEKALKRLVWLENGAYLIFDEAEALTVIDVNTGKFSGKTRLRDTVLKTNLAAAREISRQIRLRDLAGIILIDFIDMDEKDRSAVEEQVRAMIAEDGKQAKIIGFTPLGILQLTRKRTRVSLPEALSVKCPSCEGTGRILSAETVAFRLERELMEHRYSEYEAVLIETTEEVAAAFSGEEKKHQVILEDTLGFKVFFALTPSPIHFFLIKQFASETEIAQKLKEFY